VSAENKFLSFLTFIIITWCRASRTQNECARRVQKHLKKDSRKKLRK